MTGGVLAPEGLRGESGSIPDAHQPRGHEAEAATLRANVDRVTAERDEARAERAKFETLLRAARDERDQARAERDAATESHASEYAHWAEVTHCPSGVTLADHLAGLCARAEQAEADARALAESWRDDRPTRSFWQRYDTRGGSFMQVVARALAYPKVK